MSTVVGIAVLEHQASLYARAANVVFAPSSLLWGKIISYCAYDVATPARRFKVVDHTAMHDRNYFLGSALHEHKHPDAKRYHQLSQARKTKYREKFATWAASKNPHMKKHAQVWPTYLALVVASELGDT